MMRIAYICADPQVRVFAATPESYRIRDLLQALLRQGAEVSLFASHMDGVPPPGLQGIVRHWLPPLPGGEISGREQASHGLNRALAAALRRHGPFDLILERYSILCYAGMEHARAWRIPGVLQVEASVAAVQHRFRKTAALTLVEASAATAFAAATAIIAPTAEVARFLREYPGAGERVQIQPGGVDPVRFSAEHVPALPAPPNTFTIGYLGPLSPWLFVLIRAFTALRRVQQNVRLLLVGNGPDRDALEAETSAFGVTGAVCVFDAACPHELPGLLTSMDVVTAPYPDRREISLCPFPLLEAMAASRPVVASMIGPGAELVEDEVNGLHCVPGDQITLAMALSRLRRDPVLLRRLGEEARNRTIHRHSWDAYCKRLLRFVEAPLTTSRSR